MSSRRHFSGTPTHIAQQIDRSVWAGSCDRRSLVPLLQQRGVLRTEHVSLTPRDHLGLPP
ncbi:hypothetical protein LAUMK191_00528 [Mycobacterium attenuatum]|uniref:Uncharacterized protein n=1 Tax=Mycobacterium attenuatum TaxID=2341086 RepID=A0A498PPM4_9MYCO|nr:hypothetical protein LAUMK136_00534 [Mycobacterium attenuatum]VBA46103.1 hypothetical protein LAUMK191_00528 [Mycobacterium attenuatum]VBA47803.1 hypothetical protein LAUMK41_00599 [Mycobacterium attenuatum]